MINFILLNSAHEVVQRGQCRTEDEIPQVDGLTYEIVDENDCRAPTVKERNSYRDYRRFDYPNIGDQMDALWRLMSNTPQFAEDKAAQIMFAKIQEVKAKYPKS